ncbi:SPOSA6832_01904 [Sporobolomyces salmonicolor]|uniref:SPOSA6832_01904-mRNA-1:cds n=1 Tax=Sporidiobolus salmonicolor TaxID=5005 RepID=A0A0D6EL23_SPOSA|nr:SPOSA6832_01904 [Sporobolomyces salmonicolor]
MARLDLARAQSEEAWLRDLAGLKADAGSRFGDVAWAAEDSGRVVYAHKCIVYARATGNWQQRFMGVPHSLSESNLSLYGQSTTSIRTYTPQSMIHPGSTTPTAREDRRSPSPSFNSHSSTPSALRPIPLGPTDIDVFEASLEYFYTGGKETEAFAVVLDGFLDGGTDEAEDVTGIPKLRQVCAALVLGMASSTEKVPRLPQDLLFCWRSKLYSDVEIALTAPDGSASTPFAAHRAILASRSPYFRTLLLGNFGDSRLDRFTLPSPPFTPASTTFVLGYIYTGTLDFSNRNFDLTTGFEIWRCAAFLSMSALQDEIESKVAAMLTPQRAPRIFSFSHAHDVNSPALAKLALPLVLDHFDEMWATPYIGNLEYDPQDQLVKQLRARIAPNTVARLARQTSSLRKRIELERAGWARNVEAMVDAVEEKLVAILAEGLPEIVVSPGFIDLIDGVGFSTDVLEWILTLVVKGLREEKAPTAYQAIVGSVLLREEGILADVYFARFSFLALSLTHVFKQARIRVEDARNGILKYIKRKWISARESGGFDHLESWCLKELADGTPDLEVSTEDLLGGPRISPSRVRQPPKRLVNGASAPRLRPSDLPRAPAAATPPAPTPSTRAPRLSTASTTSRASLSTATSRSTVASRSTTAASSTPATAPQVRRAAATNRPAIPTPPRPPLSSTVARPAPRSSVSPAAAAFATDAAASVTTPSPVARPNIRRPSAPASSSGAPSPSASSRGSTASSVRRPPSPAPSTASTARSIATQRSSAVTRPRTTRTAASAAPGASGATPRARTATEQPSSSPSEVRKQASVSSLKSTVSTRSTSDRPARRPPSVVSTATTTRRPPSIASTRSVAQRSSDSPAKTAASATAIRAPQPKLSPRSTTATAASKGSPRPPLPSKPARSIPGTALLAGIPCIVTVRGTKPIRVRATVRYIGNLVGEAGQWVGVEVAESAIPVEAKGLAWNDGKKGDLEYFALSPPAEQSASPPEPSAPVATAAPSASTSRGSASATASLRPPSRRARRSSSAEPDSNGPRKGLFVRPNQIVYVL